jgi:ketopantoate reductase
LWEKFISQATLASLTTLTRLDIGPLRRNPDSRALFLAAMEETERVGRAVVPDLPAGLVEKAWKTQRATDIATRQTTPIFRRGPLRLSGRTAVLAQ